MDISYENQRFLFVLIHYLCKKAKKQPKNLAVPFYCITHTHTQFSLYHRLIFKFYIWSYMAKWQCDGWAHRIPVFYGAFVVSIVGYDFC